MTTDYDTYATAGALVGGALGGLMIFFVIMMIIALVLGILYIIGAWKILSKANKPGWGALIPIYNQYLLCKVTGVNPWWILIVALSPILTIIPIIGGLASFAICIYFSILVSVSLARSFGKEDGFAVGLILLAPIFYFILGVKDSTYLGAKPMSDFVFKNSEATNTTNNTTTNTVDSNAKYCSACGQQVPADTKYCPSCGKEV